MHVLRMYPLQNTPHTPFNVVTAYFKVISFYVNYFYYFIIKYFSDINEY